MTSCFVCIGCESVTECESRGMYRIESAGRVTAPCPGPRGQRTLAYVNVR